MLNSQGNLYSKETLLKENRKSLFQRNKLKAAAQSQKENTGKNEKTESDRSRLSGFNKTQEEASLSDDHNYSDNEVIESKRGAESEVTDEKVDDYAEESGPHPSHVKNDLLNYSSSEGVTSPSK